MTIEELAQIVYTNTGCSEIRAKAVALAVARRVLAEAAKVPTAMAATKNRSDVNATKCSLNILCLIEKVEGGK